VDLKRRYALFELQKRLAPSEPDVNGFIIGIESIVAAAGYGLDHFAENHFYVPASETAVGSGVLGRHTGFGHYYLYQGEPVTHQDSATAWGANIREQVTKERRARTPGWRGPRACPVSAGSALRSCD
jgi:hypothetical protein